MSNESKSLLDQMQDDEACKNCKIRKAINYIATEAASDICNNLSEKRSWEFVEEYVENVEVLLSKRVINFAFTVTVQECKFLTQRVREAGMILGIELKDHVIIGNWEGQYYSFHESGILGRDFRSDYVKEMYDLDR